MSGTQNRTIFSGPCHPAGATTTKGGRMNFWNAPLMQHGGLTSYAISPVAIPLPSAAYWRSLEKMDT